MRDDQQVRDAVLGEGGLAAGLAAGSLLLIHSTITIDTLMDLKAKLAPRQIAIVDAPVSRTRRSDDEPFVVTMLGGDNTDVQRARAIVNIFSTDVAHIGPLGAGMATKIANNLVSWVHLVVGSQAVNLAAHYGVPVEKLRAIMEANGNLTPTTRAFLDGRQTMPPGTSAEFDAFLASQAGIGEKDLALAIETGVAAELNMDMATEARKGVRGMMTKPLPA